MGLPRRDDEQQVWTIQPGEPIWMPKLGDKPEGPYWTFQSLIEDSEYCVVRAPDGTLAEYPKRYVERAPLLERMAGSDHSTELVVLFLIILAVCVAILVKM